MRTHRTPSAARLLLVLAALACLAGWSAGAASAASVTVRPGDTLGAIAARHGTTVAALVRANGLSDPNVLSVGQRIAISGRAATGTPAETSPAASSGGSYVVRSGDTLDAIAARHGTTAGALARLNGLTDPDVLSVGRRLTVPGSRPALPGATPTSSAQVAALIHLYSARHDVDPALARAIAWQESRWTQSARSTVGAIGVMQLMPATARWFGPAVLGRRIDPSRLEDNIEGGVAYLGWLRRQAGDERVAIGAYYQGLTAMRERGPYADTRDYIASVLAFRGRV